MPPAGLLAIIAVGLVLAYVLPQRIRERSDYALVRTEERYSADMRVVRSTAQRVAARDSASASAEVPLLVTGQARAQVAKVSTGHMSRPSGPLDRAATYAQRESLHLRKDRMGSMAKRQAAARRRGAVVLLTAVIAGGAWVGVAWGLPVIAAGIATGVMVSALTFSARAAAAERKALAHIRRVVREVEVAATATRALKVVTQARAQGFEAQPSAVATQAIRIVTSPDLAPLEAPELRRASEERAAQAAAIAKARREAAEAIVQQEQDEAAGWRPRTMPVPTYALKPSVRQQVARDLSEEDYAASSHAAVHVARDEAAQAPAPAAATTGALDQILARRRQASA